MTVEFAKTEMVVLQGTPFCNLNCLYCDLSAASRKRRTEMPLEMVDKVFSEIFNGGYAAEKLSVVWHSGEPLVLAPEYYQAAIDRIVALRDDHAPDVELEFDFQTNAVLISDAWIDFFTTNQRHLHLGVSCDGPAAIHDAYRTNWGGKPTHAKVLAGMTRLRDSGIPFKIISVVADATLQDPDGFFDFILDWQDSLSGFHFNILADGSLADAPGLTYGRSDRDRYYRFYRHLLRRARDHARVRSGFHVQNFAQALARILSARSDAVSQSSRPLRTLNVDAEGHVTTFYAGLERSAFADHYGDGQGLALGNILTTPLSRMVAGSKLRQIQSDFRRSQAGCQETCDYFGLCPGGFELTQLGAHGDFAGGETAECMIIVKTLADAVLDDIAETTRTREAAE